MMLKREPVCSGFPFVSMVCYGCLWSSNKNVMLYNAATPTNAYMILAIKVKLPLKMVETRLKLNKPISPQLIPPMITNNNIIFFKQITPFSWYFNQNKIFYDIIKI